MVDKLVRELLECNEMQSKAVHVVKSDAEMHLLFIEDELVLRLTKSDINNQVDRLKQIGKVIFVPKLHSYGYSFSGSDFNYILCSKLKGLDYFDVAMRLSTSQNADIGASIAGFLDSLHSIPGTGYDIGHYIPIIPNYLGTWEDGHLAYWEYIRKKMERIDSCKEYEGLYREAFSYLYAHVDALKYEQGSALLHNDLHPKNIIVEGAQLSGVIDWECSQYGEPDFELCHFIHWTGYPSRNGMDLKPCLHSIIEANPRCARVPRLDERLAIYQIEHEFMQIIWSNGNAQVDRVPRISNWLNGGVEKILA